MCIFCKIVNGEMPAYKIYEDDNFLAFLDIYPTTKGHTLVIPKQHVPNTSQLDPALAADLFSLTVKLANHISKQLNTGDYNIINNNGPLSGQAVNHIHIHIIPRYPNDNFSIHFNENKLTKDEFVTIQEQLKL